MRTNSVFLLLTDLAILVGVTLLSASGAMSYDKYADDNAPDPNATNCAACHGPFNSGAAYTELEPGGGTWPDDLMTVHSNNMLGGDCDTCHSTGGRTPVLLDSSRGGDGLMAISCVGCHGRLQDATSGTLGAGAGLRRRHIMTGASDCWESCHNHADADPGAAPTVPVGEDVLPEYYANPGTGHTIPTSPCDSSEDIAGSSNGQDNDGDLLYDGADPDCPCVAGSTPGEVSAVGLPQVQVTTHIKNEGRVAVSYGVTCCATDNNFYFGLLSDVSSYVYSGRDCSVNNTGTYDWFYPTDGQSYFFLVVADDGLVEGSYGVDNLGNQRGEDLGCEPRDRSAACN